MKFIYLFSFPITPLGEFDDHDGDINDKLEGNINTDNDALIANMKLINRKISLKTRELKLLCVIPLQNKSDAFFGESRVEISSNILNSSGTFGIVYLFDSKNDFIFNSKNSLENEIIVNQFLIFKVNMII